MRSMHKTWLILREFPPMALLIGASAFLLPGCTTLQAQSRVDPQTVAHYPQDGKTVMGSDCPVKLKSDTNAGAINLDCFIFPENRLKQQGGQPATAYEQASTDRTKRNRLASILLKQSDDVCTIEMGRLIADEAIANAGLSILTSGLSAASTIVSGETAKSILSGVATTTNATRGHINAEVYRNTLSTAILKAIQLERDRKRLEIFTNIPKTNDQYNVDQMIMDVNAYHQVCSLSRGLALVVDAVNRTTFDEADRRRSLGVAVEDIDNRLVVLNQKLSDAGLSSEDQTAIKQQISDLRTQQTEIIKQRSAITGATPHADVDKS